MGSMVWHMSMRRKGINEGASQYDDSGHFDKQFQWGPVNNVINASSEQLYQQSYGAVSSRFDSSEKYETNYFQEFPSNESASVAIARVNNIWGSSNNSYPWVPNGKMPSTTELSQSRGRLKVLVIDVLFVPMLSRFKLGRSSTSVGDGSLVAVRFQFEMPTSGGLWATVEARALAHVSPGITITMYIMAASFVVSTMKQCHGSKFWHTDGPWTLQMAPHKFFTQDIWNVVDVLFIVSFTIAFIYYLKYIGSLVLITAPPSLVGISSLTRTNYAFGCVDRAHDYYVAMAATSLCLLFKMIRTLSWIPLITLPAYVIQAGLRDFFALFVAFSTVHMGFTGCMYLMYGTQSQEFRSIGHTSAVLLRVLCGDTLPFDMIGEVGTDNDLSGTIGFLLLAVYAFFNLYLMLNLGIAMVVSLETSTSLAS